MYNEPLYGSVTCVVYETQAQLDGATPEHAKKGERNRRTNYCSMLIRLIMLLQSLPTD